MHVETKIALDCPCCGEPIYQELSWFKKTYSTCPHCDNGLAASQFDAVLAELEQAKEASIEEMIYGKASAGCCGEKSSCGGGGCH